MGRIQGWQHFSVPGGISWSSWIGVKGSLAKCHSHMVGRQGGSGYRCLSLCTCLRCLDFLTAWEPPASLGLDLEAFSVSPATLHLVKKSRLKERGHRSHAPLHGESEKERKTASSDTLTCPELSKDSHLVGQRESGASFVLPILSPNSG